MPLMLRSYRQITVGMPDDLGLKVSVPAQNLIALQPLHVYGSASSSLLLMRHQLRTGYWLR